MKSLPTEETPTLAETKTNNLPTGQEKGGGRAQGTMEVSRWKELAGP